ncbi:hypothetical protein Cfor_08971 [Coptotermes formosanus]|uniref:F-box domain-containing protein n=1 Tax=Coptotermes formosanus TaxID=36987 RepID=A0A6L2PP38_COPFO|nr:hypothetical protein Cfor_08971 [Coptotermes formosanus]
MLLPYAVFIDAEEETDENNGKCTYSRWPYLPDLVLEKVFSYLSMRERYYASMVCRSWYRAFHLPYVWSTFVLDDSTLTRRKYNYYYGWQHVLDHMRTQMCITNVGRNFRQLVFGPMMNFFNLYEFMNMLSYFIERPQGDLEIGTHIRMLRFIFPCNMAARDESERERIFGTGGRLLEALKRLMGNLAALRHLELIDLMLEPHEAQHLLDEVCSLCCLTLQTLTLINTTKLQYQLLHAGVFLNLKVLMISPQNLGEDLVQLLGHTNLCHLHIIQNRYTPGEINIRPVPGRIWKQCRHLNSRLSVHLEVEGARNGNVLWQERAPVRSILYDSSYIKMTSESVLTAIDLYRLDLHVYAHHGLPRFYMPRSFHERVDSLLLLLCRQCPYLHTLMVRERISTATVLLLAHTARNLHYLFIRRNAVILRCDWPQSPDWSYEFYQWLRSSSKSYNATEREVSQILGYTWFMLSDRQFKLTHINLHHKPF